MRRPLWLKWYQYSSMEPKLAISRSAISRASAIGCESFSGSTVPSTDAPVRISRETLRSQGKNTPYLGRELLGRVSATLVSGQVVYEAPARH